MKQANQHTSQKDSDHSSTSMSVLLQQVGVSSKVVVSWLPIVMDAILVTPLLDLLQVRLHFAYILQFT